MFSFQTLHCTVRIAKIFAKTSYYLLLVCLKRLHQFDCPHYFIYLFIILFIYLFVYVLVYFSGRCQNRRNPSCFCRATLCIAQPTPSRDVHPSVRPQHLLYLYKSFCETKTSFLFHLCNECDVVR